jgi:hypothetical protein
VVVLFSLDNQLLREPLRGSLFKDAFVDGSVESSLGCSQAIGELRCLTLCISLPQKGCLKLDRVFHAVAD